MPRITGQSGNDAQSGGGTATKERAAAKPRQTKRKVESIARSYFDAAARKDPEGMAEHWHEDGIDDLVPVRVLRGPGEVRDFFREMFTAVPDSEMVVDRVVADTNSAAVQWRATGTFTGGPFLGIDPTGKRIDLRGVDVLEIDDGKIRRNTAFYDGADFARQVGLMPPRDSGAERALFSAFNAATKLRNRIRESRSR